MARSTVDVSVVTSGHDVADARLHRQVAALTSRGMSVEVLALGRGVDAPDGTAHVRTWRRRSPVHRAPLALEMAARARGTVLLTLDPDTALAGAGRLWAGPPYRSGRGRRHLVVDAHEDYTALLRDRQWATRARGLSGGLAHGLVRAYLQVASRASLTIVADDQVPPLRARRRLVLPNLPYPGMLPAPAGPEPQPRALYIGDVRRSRGLFVMVETLRLAPAWTCDVVGPVALDDLERLRGQLSDDPELAARLRFHGRRPPAKAWAMAPGAWCGLLLLTDTPAFQRAVPSKLHEYLASGLPVVSTDLPRQAEIVRRSGAGTVVPLGDDSSVALAVAELLNGWADDPSALHAQRARARDVGPGTGDLEAHYARFADAVAELV